MSEFVASNGIVIVKHADGSARWEAGNAPVDVSLALREHVLHERDEELGRWRWPENPDYVVYQTDDKSLLVLRESVGDSEEFQTAWARCGTGDEPPETDWMHAAAAWAKAHPERKPWHSASFGEVWVLTVDGEEIPCTVNPSPDFIPVSHKRWATIARGSQRIETARRIYPEPS